MIRYNHGRFGVSLVFQWSGSVFPKALCWAIPASIIAMLLNVLKHFLEKEAETPANTIVVAFSSFVTVVGVMVVFRSNQAWSRYWQGAMMLQGVRGEWFNAASSLFAFCDRKPENEVDIGVFQRRLVRLMSFLFASALQSVSGCSLEVLSQEGMDKEALMFLDECSHDAQNGSEMKCEVIIQWVQRLIVDSTCEDVLNVPAPILSRVFQELSRGVVQIQGIRKINELPFPFPYAQMLSVLLMVYSIGVPCAAGYVMDTWWGAGGTTFVNVFVLWGFNYLASEIENPFGAKENDLPIADEMNKFNDLLRMLLHRRAQHPPSYRERNARHALRALLQAGAPDPNRKMSRVLCKEKLLRSRSALDLDDLGSTVKHGLLRVTSSGDLTTHEVLGDANLVEAWGDDCEDGSKLEEEGGGGEGGGGAGGGAGGGGGSGGANAAVMVSEQSAFTGLIQRDPDLILNWKLPQQPQADAPLEYEVTEATSNCGPSECTLNETTQFDSSCSNLASAMGLQARVDLETGRSNFSPSAIPTPNNKATCQRAQSMPLETNDTEEPCEPQRKTFPKAPKPPVRVAGVPLNGLVVVNRGRNSHLGIINTGAPREGSPPGSRLTQRSQVSITSGNTSTGRRPSASMGPASSIPESDCGSVVYSSQAGRAQVSRAGSQSSLMWRQDSVDSTVGPPTMNGVPSMIS